MAKQKNLHIKESNLIAIRVSKKLLIVPPFSVDIEIVGAAESTENKKIADKVVAKYRKRMNEDLKNLVAKLQDMQKKEKESSDKKKVYDSAKKKVEELDSQMKEDMEDIRIDIRSALQKKTRVKTQSIGRVAFRGLKMGTDAFQGVAEDKKFTSRLDKTVKPITETAAKAVNFSKSERKHRDEMLDELTKYQALFKTAPRSSMSDADAYDAESPENLKSIYKNNNAVVKKTLDAIKDYVTLVKGYSEELKAAEKSVGEMGKLLKPRKDDVAKTMTKLVTDYDKTRSTLDSDLTARLELVGKIQEFTEPPKKKFDHPKFELASKDFEKRDASKAIKVLETSGKKIADLVKKM